MFPKEQIEVPPQRSVGAVVTAVTASACHRIKVETENGNRETIAVVVVVLIATRFRTPGRWQWSWWRQQVANAPEKGGVLGRCRLRQTMAAVLLG